MPSLQNRCPVESENALPLNLEKPKKTATSPYGQAAEEQARIVAHNANIEVDEAVSDPVNEDLLTSIPFIPI